MKKEWEIGEAIPFEDGKFWHAIYGPECAYGEYYSYEDACLIVAAPDLLDALEALVPLMPPKNAPCHAGSVSQEECKHCQRIANAYKAIAKARGNDK